MRKFNIDIQQQETFFVLKTTFFYVCFSVLVYSGEYLLQKFISENFSISRTQHKRKCWNIFRTFFSWRILPQISHRDKLPSCLSLSLSGFSRKCFKYLTKNLDQRICFVFYSSHLTTVTTIKCWGKEADYSRETLTLFELIAITFFIQNDSP